MLMRYYNGMRWDACKHQRLMFNLPHRSILGLIDHIIVFIYGGLFYNNVRTTNFVTTTLHDKVWMMEKKLSNHIIVIDIQLHSTT